MSAGTLDRAPAPATPAPPPAGAADGPGVLTIDDKVVEKVATCAVGEVAGVGGVAGRVLGVRLGAETPDRAPKVRARVDGAIVTLDVTLSVTYPEPVGATTQQVREHVTERITALTGLSTRQVDITVTALHSPRAPRRTLA